MSDLFNEIPKNQNLTVESSEEDPNFNEISELSKTGYQFLKENRITEAEGCFRHILDIDADNNYALVGLGDSARKRNSFKEAVDFYSSCLACHPGNNYALFGLADCYKALNQYTKAIDIWEQYLVHDDRNITVLTRVADAYRKVRDFRKSKSLYLKVLDMEENNPYALIGLGHLHYDFKEYRDALFYWKKMLAVDDSAVDIRILTSIGNCHRKLKTFDQGIEYFERALEMSPDNFYALFGLADCYRGMNQQFKSLEYWNRILANDPRNKVILTRAGDAYRNMGDLDHAQEYYQKALNIEFDVYAVLGLAMISKQQGKYEDAISSLLRLAQSDSKNYRLYIEMADCYMKMGNRAAAIARLQEFQKYGTRNQAVAEYLDHIRQ